MLPSWLTEDQRLLHSKSASAESQPFARNNMSDHTIFSNDQSCTNGDISLKNPSRGFMAANYSASSNKSMNINTVKNGMDGERTANEKRDKVVADRIQNSSKSGHASLIKDRRSQSVGKSSGARSRAISATKPVECLRCRLLNVSCRCMEVTMHRLDPQKQSRWSSLAGGGSMDRSSNAQSEEEEREEEEDWILSTFSSVPNNAFEQLVMDLGGVAINPAALEGEEREVEEGNHSCLSHSDQSVKGKKPLRGKEIIEKSSISKSKEAEEAQTPESIENKKLNEVMFKNSSSEHVPVPLSQPPKAGKKKVLRWNDNKLTETRYYSLLCSS